MVYSERLAGRIRDALARMRRIEEKKMFGGVGFLLSGNMLVGVWGQSLIARLGPASAERALSEPDVREFNVTGKPMKGWVLVDPDGIDSDQKLWAWIERAAAFVGDLPPKPRKRRS